MSVAHVTYRGGELDGKAATVGPGVTRVTIPVYGNGYDRRPTRFLIYVRAGRFLIARRPQSASKHPERVAD